jgi:hypothetical protein
MREGADGIGGTGRDWKNWKSGWDGREKDGGMDGDWKNWKQAGWRWEDKPERFKFDENFFSLLFLATKLNKLQASTSWASTPYGR